MGNKDVWYTSNILIEQVDAELIKVGDTVTFVHWGNLKIVDIRKGTDDKVIEIQADLDLENTAKYFFKFFFKFLFLGL